MSINWQWLQFFEDISCFYRHMLMLPLWNKYPNHQNNIIDSLAIFLEGYAFERQGRKPDYCYVAIDSLIYCYQQSMLSANCVWNRFRGLLNNQNLNQRNNPLYPSSNPDNLQNISDQLSIVEVVLQNRISLSNYIHNLIINNKINEAFNLLKRVRGIGDKIASFYLRDLAVVLNVNLNDIQNRWLLQPIDKWVKRTVNSLNRNQNMNNQQIASWIVDNSLQYNLNPEYVNMGIWFYGAQIASSEYRLTQSLLNINTARSLISNFLVKISNAYQYCLNHITNLSSGPAIPPAAEFGR